MEKNTIVEAILLKGLKVIFFICKISVPDLS